MAGQIALQAAQLSLNFLAGSLNFTVSSTPPTFVPGLVWINSGQSNTPYFWNGTTWVNGKTRYLTLLTADPNTSGAGGTRATKVSDLVEVTTPGFARSAVTMGLSSNNLPCVTTNTGMINFGPVTADMAVPAKWAALVTVQSGSAGILCYTWDGFNEQVSASQVIEVPVNGLILSQQ